VDVVKGVYISGRGGVCMFESYRSVPYEWSEAVMLVMQWQRQRRRAVVNEMQKVGSALLRLVDRRWVQVLN